MANALSLLMETYIEFFEGPVEFLVVEPDDISFSVGVDCDLVLTCNSTSREFDMSCKFEVSGCLKLTSG